MSETGSYQQVTESKAAQESARLQAQLKALWAHEARGFTQVGFPRNPARLLEVGCGNGAVLSQAKAEFGAGAAFGVDIDAQLLSRARAVVPVSRATGSALPFASETFDAVFFRYVLRHVSSPAALLAEAKRVLKPGGWVVVLDADDGALLFDPPPPRWNELSKALDESVRRRGANPHMGRTLHRLLFEAGLSKVTTAAQVLTSSQVPAAAFVELFLAPSARPVDPDLLAPAEAQLAWAALRGWALKPESFCCGLGVFAGGCKL